MPIFENERNPYPYPDPTIKLEQTVDVNIPSYPVPSLYLSGNQPQTPAITSFEDIGKYIGQRYTYSSELIPYSKIFENWRYPGYRSDLDLEHYYGVFQPAYKKVANALVKTGANFLGSFINGILMPVFWTTGPVTGDYTGKEVMTPIDEFLHNYLENAFPNYYTREQRETVAMGIIPGTRGSADFWFDKLFKNLAFFVGSATSTAAWVGLLSRVPGLQSVGALAAQAGAARSLGALRRIFTAVNRSKTSPYNFSVATKALGISDDVAQAALASAAGTSGRLFNSGLLTGFALVNGTLAEATMEARGIAMRVKEDAVNKFRYLYNRDPNDEEMAEIERIKDDSYSTALALESTILGISNSLMFGKAIRSMFRAAEINRGLAKTGTLAREFVERQGLKFIGGRYILSEAEKELAKSGFRKTLWSGAKTLTGAALVEGVWEEGLQFATEVGVAKYYADKLDNELFKLNYASIPDVLASAKYAIKQQFTSVEGLESMILGALSAVGIVGARRILTGKKEEQARNKFMEYLNDTSAFSTLRKRLPLLFEQANAARELDEKIDQGDSVGQKLAKDKVFFYNALSRAQKGAIDVFIDELNTIAEMSDEEFEEAFGKPDNGFNKREFINSLIEEAKKIDGAYKIIDSTMPNPFVFREDPKDEKQIEENRKYLAFEQLKADVTRAFYNTERYTRENLELDNKIKEALGNTVSAEELVKMYTKEGVQNEKDRVQQEIKNKEQQKQSVLAAKDPVTNKVDTRALLEIENQIKSLKKYEALLDDALDKKTPSVELLHAFATQHLFNNTTPEISYAQFVPIQSDLMQYLANKIEIGKSVAVYSYAQDKNNIGKLLEKNLKQQEQIDEALLRAIENDILEERKEEELLEKTRALEADNVNPEELKLEPIFFRVNYGSFDVKFDPNTKKYIVTHPYLMGQTLEFDTREEALEAVKRTRNIVVYTDPSEKNSYIRVGDYYKRVDLNVLQKEYRNYLKISNALFLQNARGTKDAELTTVDTSEPYKLEIDNLFSSTVVPEPGTTIPAYHKVFTSVVDKLDKNQTTDVAIMLITRNNEKAYGLTVASELEAQGIKDPIVVVLAKQDPNTRALHFIRPDGSIGDRVTYDSKIEMPTSLITYTVLPDPSLTWQNGEKKYKALTPEEEQKASNALLGWIQKRQQILSSNQAIVYGFVVRRQLTADTGDIAALSQAKDFKFSKTERKEIVMGVTLPENTYYIIANGTLYLYEPNKISDSDAQFIYDSLIHFNLPTDTSGLSEDDLIATTSAEKRRIVSGIVYFTKQPTNNSISVNYSGRTVSIGNKTFKFSELEKNKQGVINAIKELTYVIPEQPSPQELQENGKITGSTNNDFTYITLRQFGSNNQQPPAGGTAAARKTAQQATSQAAQQSLQQSPLSQSELEARKADIERRREEELRKIEEEAKSKKPTKYLETNKAEGYLSGLQGDTFTEVTDSPEGSFFIIFDIKGNTAKYRVNPLNTDEALANKIHGFKNEPGIIAEAVFSPAPEDVRDLEYGELVREGDGWKITKRLKVAFVLSQNKSTEKRKSEVNAKYDAELRALEEQYKAEEQQPTQQATPQSTQQATQQPTQGKSEPSNTIEPGRYVKYKGETYIVTKIKENGTIQIYNPEKEGTGSKKSVSKNNLTPTDALADIVEYKGKKYIVTPKDTIISLTTNKKMNWGENNKERKAILKLRDEKNKKDESKAEALQIEEGKQEPSQQPSSRAALGAKLLAPDILTQQELEDKNLVETFELEGSELQENIENLFPISTNELVNLLSSKISDFVFSRNINNRSPEEKLDIIAIKAAINNGLGIREGVNEFFGKSSYLDPGIYRFKFSYSSQKGIKIEDERVSYINIKDDTLYNSVNNRLDSYVKNIEGFNKLVDEEGYFVLLNAYGHEDAASSFSSEATKELIDSKKIKFIDTESGKECNSPGGPAPQAAAGMAIGGITLGGEWEIVKEFVGPSHAKGGINITVGENGVRITKQDNSEFKAKYGLVIPASDFEQ